MRRIILICLALPCVLLGLTGLAAAQSPDTLWTHTYGGSFVDEAFSVQQTLNGGYIIAGWTIPYPSGNDNVYLIQTDSSGNVNWTRTYGGNNSDKGWSVQQTQDGGYIVTGYTASYGAGDYDVYLIKTNASGDTVWTQTYGGNGADIGYSVRQTQDGGYIVTGLTASFGAGNYDVYLIKTDASGNAVWTRTYGNANIDLGYCVRQTQEGGYIIVGYTVLSSQSYVYLIKTDVSGDTLWTRTYGQGNSNGYSVRQTQEGGYIIVGSANSDVYLIKTDSSGSVLWTHTYGGNYSDDGFDVQQTLDGGYIIAGSITGAGFNEDVYIIKTDSLGGAIWTKTCGGSSYDYGWSVQQTSDSGFVIAGYTASFGAGYDDVYLIRLAANPPPPPPTVEITLAPTNPPIMIQPEGGQFNYTITATNNNIPRVAAVWCMVTLPNGSPYGPVLGPVTVTLNPGQTLERLRTQIVPAGAPAGNYAFNAYIGVYPDTVWDSDSFVFSKSQVGTQIWEARYNGPGNGWDLPTSIAVDPNGNVYVTGLAEYYVQPYGLFEQYATIKYNSSGNQLWVAFYNQGGDEVANDIAVDDSGNVYVTGASYASGTYDDYATVKYNASGTQVWAVRYDGGGSTSLSGDVANSLAVDDSGNVYVTGESYFGGDDYATIKYNGNGNQVWVARYSGPYLSDRARSLAVDGGGNVYVTGESYGSYGSGNNLDYVTIKYDGNGNELWVARYNGPGDGSDHATALALDAAGNVYVTGSTHMPYGIDYGTIKYDANGNELWVAFYDYATYEDKANAVAVDGNGNVYVTGRGSFSDYATVKYDSNGNQIWAVGYGTVSGSDEAVALALDAAGNVYVTGCSEGSGTGPDYATIKYDPDGNQIWVARYNGPSGSDGAHALALDDAGDVYVTGSSVGSGTGPDYCTIKYSGGNIDNWLPVEATVLGQPLPQECALNQNYPNPFNASTAISYQLSANSYVSLRVYDTAGRLVETLVDGWRSAGEHELTFDASDLPSGMYVYRIQAGDFAQAQKMILIK